MEAVHVVGETDGIKGGGRSKSFDIQIIQTKIRIRAEITFKFSTASDCSSNEVQFLTLSMNMLFKNVWRVELGQQQVSTGKKGRDQKSFKPGVKKVVNALKACPHCL